MSSRCFVYSLLRINRHRWLLIPYTILFLHTFEDMRLISLHLSVHLYHLADFVLLGTRNDNEKEFWPLFISFLHQGVHHARRYVCAYDLGLRSLA